MRKIIVSEFVSLDGVLQATGGVDEDMDGGFAHGDWTAPFWHDDIGANFDKEISHCDTLLVGRKTWQIHGAAFEPMPESDDPFGNLQKVVISTTLRSASAWRNSTLVNKNFVDEIRKLKEQPGKDIYVDGSSVLVHMMARNHLVDEYCLLVFPIVLGGEKKVFPEGFHLDLKLVETKTFPTGVILLRYQPNGKK